MLDIFLSMAPLAGCPLPTIWTTRLKNTFLLLYMCLLSPRSFLEKDFAGLRLPIPNSYSYHRTYRVLGFLLSVPFVTLTCLFHAEVKIGWSEGEDELDGLELLTFKLIFDLTRCGILAIRLKVSVIIFILFNILDLVSPSSICNTSFYFLMHASRLNTSCNSALWRRRLWFIQVMAASPFDPGSDSGSCRRSMKSCPSRPATTRPTF